MNRSDRPQLLAGEAAQTLGISVKALRLYESRGLIRPSRSAAGYRQYGPEVMCASRDVVARRALGLPLSQIANVIAGDVAAMAQALALRETELSASIQSIQGATDRLRTLRESLLTGASRPGSLADALADGPPAVEMTLPWPWGGERWVLQSLAPLTYLVGPLGSGKTCLSLALSNAIHGGKFLAETRSVERDAFPDWMMVTAVEEAEVKRHLDWLVDEGADNIDALRFLVTAATANRGLHPLVIDMIETGLSRASQEALMRLLRRITRTRPAPVIAMTRSSSILDLRHVDGGEAILFCPANHALPYLVRPWVGAQGYEALASCLATPEARKRLALGSPTQEGPRHDSN